jgi:NAD(P)H-hydrate epimerase
MELDGLDGKWIFEEMRLMKIRFVSPAIKEKYDLELPEYEGIDQVVEVGMHGEKL